MRSTSARRTCAARSSGRVSREAAVALADRAPDGVDDDGFAQCRHPAPSRLIDQSTRRADDTRASLRGYCPRVHHRDTGARREGGRRMGRGSIAKVRDAHDRRKRKKARLKRRRTENTAARPRLPSGRSVDASTGAGGSPPRTSRGPVTLAAMTDPDALRTSSTGCARSARTSTRAIRRTASSGSSRRIAASGASRRSSGEERGRRGHAGGLTSPWSRRRDGQLTARHGRIPLARTRWPPATDKTRTHDRLTTTPRS